mmetsp:Transcript_49035/g.76505  ORF Transcript_49035/g.76505 Transcript_49035/m.76505 type:complete len:1026 (+) Transcript_49035:72-3149(+)
MGCRCSGSTSEQLEDEYGFNLSDFPASVTAVESNEKGFLDLHLAGIVQPGLISKIERGLERRGLIIASAEMSFEQGILNGVINVKLASSVLRPGAGLGSDTTEVLEVNVGFTSPSQVNRMRSSTQSVVGPTFTMGPTSTMGHMNSIGTCIGAVVGTPGAYFDSVNKALPFIVHARHTWGSYVRAVLLEQAAGSQAACMKMHIRIGDSQCEEAFWFQCTNTTAGDLTKLVGSKERMQAWLQKTLTIVPPESEPADLNSSVAPEDLLHALEDRDRRERISKLKELPRVVARVARKVKYELIRQDEFGTQFDGCIKYIGSGLVRSQNIAKKEGEVVAVMLECTTLVVRSNLLEENNGTWLPPASGGVSEMVCRIDTKGRRFFIQKCFLNEVLPSGKKAGAQLVAEQLYAPVNLWKNNSSATTSGKDAGGERWLIPLRDLVEIKLCDVVNWNTYAILSTVLGEDLGEHMRPAVTAELRRSQLPSIEECRKLPLLHVFIKTCLGRLVQNVLSIWIEASGGGVNITPNTVKVESAKNSFENIAGENRHPLDITVYLQSGIRLGTIVSFPPSCGALSPVKSPELIGMPQGMCHMATHRASAATQQSKHFTALHEWLHGPTFADLVPTVEQKRALLDVRMFLLGRWISQIHGGSEIDAKETENGKDASLSALSKKHFVDVESGMQIELVFKLVLAVSRVVVQLQRERGASCLASASGGLGSLGDDGGVEIQRLFTQRANVDAAILEALAICSVEFTPDALVDVVRKGDVNLRTTSKRLLLHRSYVDTVLSSRSHAGREWIERFHDVALGSDGFSLLIDVLLEWFLCGAHALAGPADAIRADALGLISYLQEHLGQERAMVCARSDDTGAIKQSPMFEDRASVEFFERHVEQRRMICSLLLPFETSSGFEAISSTLNIMVSQNLKKHRKLIADTLGESSDFQEAFASLESMEKLLLSRACVETSNNEVTSESRERFDTLRWWNAVTTCIDVCQCVAEKLLMNLRHGADCDSIAVSDKRAEIDCDTTSILGSTTV